MSETVLKVENLYKRYRLGLVNHTALVDDINILWAKMTGKPNPTETYITANELVKAKKDDIKARYVWALQDINLEVKRGEILGIIGKNGAGKSTLLKILSKTTAPTKGNVKMKGRVASLLEVGTGFHPELTGRENIYLNGMILGMKKREIDKKLDEIVDFAGVETYLDTPTKRYSSGMKVRLGFAVAAHLEPDILIVDEVLAVGDAEFQKKAIGKMKEVSSGQGRTVLFVSHNMNSVKTLCNRGVVLKNGQLAFTGETDDAIANYLGADIGSLTYVKLGEEWSLEGFQLLSAGVRAKNKEFGEPITRDDEIEFVFEYDYREKIAESLNFTLQFKADNGEIVFVTGTGLSTLNAKKLKLGHYGVKMIIPDKYLNDGNFALNLLLVKNSREIYSKQEDLLSFTILPDNRKVGTYSGKMKGILSPHFNWEFQPSISKKRN